MPPLYAILFWALGASATTIIGNGGDLYSASFISKGDTIKFFLRDRQPGKVDFGRFAETLSKTKVESTSKNLTLGGAVKDAINYPGENRIVFNRGRWDVLTDRERTLLVLHEYLGIMRLDDSTYQISIPLVDEIKKTVINRSVISLDEVLLIHSGKEKTYALSGRIEIESAGAVQVWHNTGREVISLSLEANGKKRQIKLDLAGHVLLAWNKFEGADAGIYLRVLQPLIGEDGKLEKLISAPEHAKYFKHIVREYRIDFVEKRGELPVPEVIGPLANTN